MDYNGITLIALVITIIVLLILAGVSLSMVFSQDGIFNRAEQGADKYGQAKARETLEMLLGEAQMQKYESGLTDEELTDKINSIGEDIKEGTDSRISQAIVDGYIFEVDRTVPKILDYIGPADGVIITAEADRLKIRFSATGHDNESGLKHFKYTITSTQDTTLEGIPEDKRTGTFTLGQTVEIVTTPTGDRDETTYTITATATDNADNVSTNKTADVTAIDGITVAEAKQLVNEENYPHYIGTRIIDYNPDNSGIVWRVFYCEDSNNYFGDGEGTIYLKRDIVSNDTCLSVHQEHSSSDELKIMRQLNPMWRDSPLTLGNITTLSGKLVSWLCDPNEWKELNVEGVTKYAVGAAPIEMWLRAYSNWVSHRGQTDVSITCAIEDRGNGRNCWILLAA